jgi:hypothetical protein
MRANKRMGVWLTAAQAEGIRALAQSRGIALCQLIRDALQATLDRSNPRPASSISHRPDDGSVPIIRHKMTIYLRPGDVRLLCQRAHTRGMRPSTYTAAVMRAHLRVQPPMPSAELLAIKQAARELGDIARDLRHLVDLALQNKWCTTELTAQLATITEQTTHFRAALSKLIQANLISWESDFA